MATRYVDPDSTAGGTGITNALTGTDRAYASLAAWEAARQGTLTEVEECICCSNGGSHTADGGANPLDIDGWTTSAAYYVLIRTDVGSRHPGYWDTTKYRFTYTGAPGDAFRVYEEHVRIQGLQFYLNRVDDWSVAVNFSFCDGATAQTARVDGCYFQNTGGTDGVFVRATAGIATSNTLVSNSIFNDGTNVALAGLDTPRPLSAWNNTFIGCAQGISTINSPANNITAINNLFSGCTLPCDNYVNFATGTGYNATTSGSMGYTVTGGATGDRVSQTFTFAGTGDYHLAANDAGARGYGLDLSANFTTDIDGETRPTGAGTWDIGADEYVAAGGASILRQMLAHHGV